MIAELIEYIIKQLVDHPERVVIHQKDDQVTGAQAFLIQVDLQDRGKIIGKEGKTIKNLRLLIKNLVPQHKKFYIDLYSEQ